MEHIKVELKTINTIFPSVAEAFVNDSLVAYICENKDANRESKPQSVVLTTGENLGDYCCIKCAVKAIAKKHLGEDGIYIAGDNPLAQFGAFGMLLAALAELPTEKSPHEAG
ncbi:hypothetical protein [Buttiauxella sp. S19-1]|uniref:hypothetical protein n=1 Tax=Buttiauxella sp. S19-1 TaxID=941430 RepID=UPI001EDABAD9|nr:hypothetical protein [Buttiauxella sp. S19-1]